MTVTIQSTYMSPAGNSSAVTTTRVTGGRSYSCAGNSQILVPWFDADILEINGWIKSAAGGSGTTAQRPTVQPSGQPLPRGYQFHDTTLGHTIVYEGTGVWADPNSGAAV